MTACCGRWRPTALLARSFARRGHSAGCRHGTGSHCDWQSRGGLFGGFCSRRTVQWAGHSSAVGVAGAERDCWKKVRQQATRPAIAGPRPTPVESPLPLRRPSFPSSFSLLLSLRQNENTIVYFWNTTTRPDLSPKLQAKGYQARMHRGVCALYGVDILGDCLLINLVAAKPTKTCPASAPFKPATDRSCFIFCGPSPSTLDADINPPHSPLSISLVLNQSAPTPVLTFFSL